MGALDSAAAEATSAAFKESKLAVEQKEELAFAASDLPLAPSEPLGLTPPTSQVWSLCRCQYPCLVFAH